MNSFSTVRRILLNSSDGRASSPGSTASIKYTLPNFPNMIGLQLTNFRCPNVIYTIRTGVNSQFFMNGNPVNIPEGTYQINTLSSVLTTLLGGNFVVSILPYDLKLRITNTAPFTLSFPTRTPGAIPLQFILGWPNQPDNVDLPTVSNIVSPSTVQLLNSTKIGVKITTDSQETNLLVGYTTRNQAYSFRVDLFSNFGTETVYRPAYSDDQLISFNSTLNFGGNINVELFDLELGTSFECGTYTLELSSYKQKERNVHLIQQ